MISFFKFFLNYVVCLVASSRFIRLGSSTFSHTRDIFNKPLVISIYGTFLTIFPVAGILAFRPPGLGSYSRATASYSFEWLVAAALFKDLFSWKFAVIILSILIKQGHFNEALSVWYNSLVYKLLNLVNLSQFLLCQCHREVFNCLDCERLAAATNKPKLKNMDP